MKRSRPDALVFTAGTIIKQRIGSPSQDEFNMTKIHSFPRPDCWTSPPKVNSHPRVPPLHWWYMYCTLKKFRAGCRNTWAQAKKSFLTEGATHAQRYSTAISFVRHNEAVAKSHVKASDGYDLPLWEASLKQGAFFQVSSPYRWVTDVHAKNIKGTLDHICIPLICKNSQGNNFLLYASLSILYGAGGNEPTDVEQLS